MIRDLGRFGEELVAHTFPKWKLRRQPGSGNRWPRQEDLEGPRHLVQVKTTRGNKFMDAWLDLMLRSKSEAKMAVWLEVNVSPDEKEAVIFERRFLKVVELGVGGE